jgi:hypothetical protein
VLIENTFSHPQINYIEKASSSGKLTIVEYFYLSANAITVSLCTWRAIELKDGWKTREEIFRKCGNLALVLRLHQVFKTS